jgi:hypothetical protein
MIGQLRLIPLAIKWRGTLTVNCDSQISAITPDNAGIASRFHCRRIIFGERLVLVEWLIPAATELGCAISQLTLLSPQDSANLVWRPALAFVVNTNQKFGDHARHHQHAGRDKHHYRKQNKDIIVKPHWKTLLGQIAELLRDGYRQR